MVLLHTNVFFPKPIYMCFFDEKEHLFVPLEQDISNFQGRLIAKTSYSKIHWLPTI